MDKGVVAERIQQVSQISCSSGRHRRHTRTCDCCAMRQGRSIQEWVQTIGRGWAMIIRDTHQQQLEA